jgi:hypothetical protein
MSLKTISARVFFLVLVAGFTMLSADRTNAQDRIQARVVGFAVRAEGVTPDPSPLAMAKLGDRVTVRIDPLLPSPPDQQPTKPSGPSMPPAAAAGSGSTDEQSWIPGLTHAQILKLVPYLDDRPLKGLYPETVDPDSHTLTFHLDRSQATQEAWTDLLRNPGFDPRVMTFSVGLEDKQQLPTKAKISLVVIPKKWFIASIAVFFILLYITFRLADGTSLLRDPGIGQGYMPGITVLWRRPSPDTHLGPYSLARTQMAFWFFLVISAFVLIWMIIGDTDTITQGVLVLIGISAGTALGATAIDSSKRKTTPAPAVGAESKGFLNDILSDGTGVSFHRFQIVVWTIVLGFIFSRRVLNHLAMPEFGTNLLTLMGISSGTYLGLKLPEQYAPAAPPENTQSQGAADVEIPDDKGNAG